MWTKQAFYDQREKAGKLLLIPQRAFYERLYKPECSRIEEAQDVFLNKLQFQLLSEENKLTADLLEAIGDTRGYEQW